MPGVNRRGFLKALGLGAAAVAAPRLAWADPEPRRQPNFVFILADDLGWRDVGCAGSTFYETPNIDRLAAQGVRFTQGYAAAPVCSPTRASIVTGKYPARVKVTNFIGGHREGKLLPAAYLDHLPLEEVTLAEALKEAGYRTGYAGKWHLGGPAYFPRQQGFDVEAGVHGGPVYFPPYKKPDLPDGPAGEYLTDRLTDEALKFLDGHGGKPFLLYLAHHAVHIPLMAKKDLVAKYQAKAEALPPAAGPKFAPEGEKQARQVQDHAVYAAMVQSLDESVGRIMKKLEDLGLADRTVVIFMSDNGGLSTAEGTPTSNVPLRAGKGWLYEGGIREPLIIKWPGVTKAGRLCAEPVTSTDFYPTMLEMAGAPLRPRQHCDGVSLVPLLKEERALDRKALFWHYPHYSNQGGGPSSAVRAGEYKLIRFHEDNRAELYNLKDDEGEKNDLADKMPDKVKELGERLDRFLKDADAAFPRPNPDFGRKPDAKRDARKKGSQTE
jgi:arylsulfatase A-like enzyme